MHGSERSDQEHRWCLWMIAAQAGDGAAYEKLLLEILPLVRAQVAMRVREVAERDDVVQNVLMSVHRARHTYRSDRPFVPWLRAVVRNATIDWMRARGRRARREQVGDPVALADAIQVAPEVPDGEDALSPELARALGELTDGQREAVELLHVEGLSVAEAAERVGVSPGALKVRAHRGYRALRKSLSKDRT